MQASKMENFNIYFCGAREAFKANLETREIHAKFMQNYSDWNV